MPRPTLVLVMLSWAALLLPWERCTSDCHDLLEPGVGAHDCHDEGRDCDGGEEPDHERVEFVSLAPQGKVAVDAAALLCGAPAPEAFLQPRVAAPSAEPGPRAPPSRLKGVVLLL